MAEFTTTVRDLSTFEGKAFEPLPVLHTAEHAVNVYSDASGYGFGAMAAGYESGTIVDRRPAQIGLAWSSSVIVVAARGSSAPRDWLHDLASVWLVGWPGVMPAGCQVGYGFRCQVRAVMPEVVERILTLRRVRPKARIVVTGHSLGAALVPLIVAYLDSVGLPVAVAVAHEMPRVGNAVFQRWYDPKFTYATTPTWSVVNVAKGEPDLVTRLPKRRWGFRHVGRRVILAAAETLFGDDAWQRHRAEHPVGNRAAAWRIVTRFARSVRAHYGRHLLESLRARI